MVVQSLVDRAGHDAHRRVRRAYEIDACRRGDNAQEAGFARATFRQNVERGRARVSGRQHRIQREDVGAAEVFGQVRVVGHRCESFRVAKKSEMRDDRIVNDREKAGQEPEPGAQDRRDDGTGRDAPGMGLSERRRDLDVDGAQRVRRFVREQRTQLFDETPKFRYGRRCVAQAREAVGDGRMTDDADAGTRSAGDS